MGDILRAQRFEPGFLLRRRGGVDPAVIGFAELLFKIGINFGRVAARHRLDLGGQQIEDDAVFVGGPDPTVKAQE